MFLAGFNTHKIVQHVLQRQGATFGSSMRTFWRRRPDFHPTDVLEDADGSLLVIDTGGWFRIGCPTSQIAKPEVKGAIYRIRRTDAAPVLGSAQTENRLGTDLGHDTGRSAGRPASRRG